MVLGPRIAWSASWRAASLACSFLFPTTQTRFGADCVYVPAEQWAQVNWDGQGYFPAVPWLVIEVISPSDSAADIAEKVQDYLAGGARSVWCVYPQKRTIHVYSEDAPPRFLLKTATLTDDDILPGFAAPLAWIFN